MAYVRWSTQQEPFNPHVWSFGACIYGLRIKRSSRWVDYGMNRVTYEMRIDSWLNVPNSYVNDDGKPNLNNSNAENDNDARVLVRIEVALVYTFTPAADLSASLRELSLQFEGVSVINKVKLQ